MTNSLDVITDYCRRNSKRTAIRDLAYSVYCQQYETLSKDAALTPDAINKILLSEPSLVSHVRTAEETIAIEIQQNEATIRRELAFKGFGMSVLSGVVGNIAYSLLLLLIFFLARDQISSWLTTVASSQP